MERVGQNATLFFVCGKIKNVFLYQKIVHRQQKKIPNTFLQVDFNEADYEDYLKVKWDRGL